MLQLKKMEEGGDERTPIVLCVGKKKLTTETCNCADTDLFQQGRHQLNAITSPVLPQACWKSEREPKARKVSLVSGDISYLRSNYINGVCRPGVHDSNNGCCGVFFATDLELSLSKSNTVSETITGVYISGWMCANNIKTTKNF